MKISKKWRKMAQVYELFAKNLKSVSFTEQDAMEVYAWETHGSGCLKSGVFPEKRLDGTYNGYMIGKIWKDWHVTEWKADIKKKLLFVWELYAEHKYPKWWLDNIFERAKK